MRRAKVFDRAIPHRDRSRRCFLPNHKKKRGAEAPHPLYPFCVEQAADQRCLMISSANSLHFTSVLPSIRRAKS